MSKENSRFGNNTQIKGMLCLCWLFEVTVAKFDTVTKSAYKFITAAAMLLSNCYAVYLRSLIKHYKCYKAYISYHIHSSNKTLCNHKNTIRFVIVDQYIPSMKIYLHPFIYYTSCCIVKRFSLRMLHEAVCQVFVYVLKSYSWFLRLTYFVQYVCIEFIFHRTCI